MLLKCNYEEVFMRQFYLGRNSSGYYRVYFIDPVTGIRDSGKSTHTKDKVEATMIATSWLQNGAPDCRSNSRAFSNPTSLIPINLKNMVEHLSEDDARIVFSLLTDKFGFSSTLSPSTKSQTQLKSSHAQEKGIKLIVSKSGRYGGGTFAHTDIAMSFATWLSPEFQLYIMKDYRRLKSDENSRLSLNWNLNRELSKLNYKIHTDAIKENLIIPELTPAQKSFVYADEADLLNVALFGQTAKEWRKDNPGKKGNIRDYTDLHHLLVLANLESYNAILIEQNIEQPKRLELLRATAIKQLRTIMGLDFTSQKILSISEKNEE